MSRDELIDGFLRLASDFKIKNPFSPKYQRQRAGRKGIGRFATNRLGDQLVLQTRKEGEARGWKLTVNWLKFTSGRALSDVPVQIEPVGLERPGTILRIESLFDVWTDSQIKRCWRNVLGLQQPFPVAPVDGSPVADPGFTVRFLREDGLFADETVVADLKTEILDHLHAVVEFRVDDLGFAEWRISQNKFGDTFDWQAINSYEQDAATPPPYVELRNAWMKAHYVVLKAELLPSLVYTRVRDELGQQGGIRLYRNGFRVVPYGDPDNDWLELDAAYVKRSELAPIANRNFLGVIEVRDPDGALFEEHTSREGLLETPAFAELKHLASAVLITAAGRIQGDRGKKIKAGKRSEPTAEKNAEVKHKLQELKTAFQDVQKTVMRVGNSSEKLGLEKAVKVVEEVEHELEVAKTQLADETAMLRFLATLGMTTAEFSHETGMTFDAFRFDFERVFKTALEAPGVDQSFLEQANRARAMLNRLDTLTSYLNALASTRSARGIRPVSLSRIVESFERGIRAQAESEGVELKVVVPDFDPLFSRPMHEAELASMLLNFYTNAVKAVKRAGGARRILVLAERSPAGEDSVRLRFADSGDGVPDGCEDRIFDAFFTTRVSPSGGASDTEHARGTGLGLWIVSQIAMNAGGEIVLSTPPDGYVTCFDITLPSENDDDA